MDGHTSPRSGSLRVEYPSLEEHLRSILGDLPSQRVLVAAFNQWPFSLASAADVVAELHTRGARVRVALWATRTPLSDVGMSTYRWLTRAVGQTSTDERVRQALISFGLPKESFVKPPLKRRHPVGDITIPEVLTRSQIRAMTYRGSPMGRAILQVHPDRNTPMADDHEWPRRWITAAARSYAYVYDNIRAVIAAEGITSVLVYNGRFLHDQAAQAAAVDSGVQVFFFDSAGTQSDYEVTSHAIHDWAALQDRMQQLYAAWPVDERDALGSSWFEDRMGHRDPHNQTFVDAQVIGKAVDLPEGKKVVSYFSSSGDEIIELDIDWDEYFRTQEEALKILAEEVRRLDNHVLVVRSHPHKRLKPPRDLVEWTAAVQRVAPDIHIDPYSEIDSYALMRASDVVVTYGSTAGVEAAFARRPVIVMGPSAYDRLGCAVRVTDREGLRTALIEKQVGEWSGAVAYGLMAVRRGHAFVHVTRDVDGTPCLAGVRLGEPAAFARHVSHAIKARRLNYLTSA